MHFDKVDLKEKRESIKHEYTPNQINQTKQIQNNKCAASIMGDWSDGLLFDLAKLLRPKAHWHKAGRNGTKSEKVCMDVPREQ